MNETPAIRIQHLILGYGPHRVLDGLSLQVPAGSITALLGGNGAGKSTALATLRAGARHRPRALRPPTAPHFAAPTSG